MRAAIGQRIDRVVRALQRLEEIEVAVGVIEDREIDEPGALVLHQQVVGIFGRIEPRRSGAGEDAFGRGRLVVEAGVHFELKEPPARDHAEEIDDVGFGHDVVFRQHPRLERRILEPGELFRPRQRLDLDPRGLEAERVDGAAPGHDDAVAAQRDLRNDVGTCRVLLAHRRDLFFERQFLGDRLQCGEGHRQAGFAAERAHPLELVPFTAHVAGHFEHAMADAAHCPTDCDQFLGGGGGAGDQLAVDRLVQDRAAGREAERPGPNAFFDDRRHLRDIGVGGNRAGHLSIAQHIGPYRAMRHVGADIDAARHPLERVEIFGEALPIPLHPFGQRGAGDVFDALHQRDQPLVALGRGRGKADPAVAHDHSGDAVPR